MTINVNNDRDLTTEPKDELAIPAFRESSCGIQPWKTGGRSSYSKLRRNDTYVFGGSSYVDEGDEVAPAK